ncbi:hypothetical protein [Maribacter hydrothermalis]|uniref:Tetratricopeptide repeat-containing protein n=1 Tax=Maribacter hydrothermalis TaxID=1836467 RepID=A0A1B7YY29_9FLAO|nr:hypothetical protein [Maribacter hydrothermalis]APQ16858.1 hypothetical protein BTR34_05775 [Maribacter hydrothermalis]OBR35286.1 hypothetical protein A9200_12005 [Maribacter hydrothermalis]
MNVKDFTYFLEHPTKVVEPIHTKHLEDIIAEYPYFQAARALHLKGLKNLNSYKYNKALKTTAAFTTDRDVLFDFIISKDFLQDNSSEIETKDTTIYTEEIVNEEPISDTETIAIDNTKEEEIKPVTLIEESEDKPLPQDEHDAEHILDPELFQSKKASPPTDEESLELGKPLSFNAKEKYSFSEWLSLASNKPLEKPISSVNEKKEIKKPVVAPKIETVKEKKAVVKSKRKASTKEEALKKKKFDRIDKFISNNPKIVPSEFNNTVIDISGSSKIDKNELMTETLARVYLEQKKYKKAIQAFKILSLKYPEKSSFFANRIKAVEKIQKDNK